MKTAQETFDIVANHLLTQGVKSVKLDMCQYRHDGKKCAIGCLITDEEYKEEIENQSPEWLVSQGYLTNYSDHIDLLEELQIIHDDRDPAGWEMHLTTVAVDFGLATNF